MGISEPCITASRVDSHGWNLFGCLDSGLWNTHTVLVLEIFPSAWNSSCTQRHLLCSRNGSPVSLPLHNKRCSWCCRRSHEPTANALDFPLFTFAPDAASYLSNASRIIGISSDFVTKIDTSSAYAIVAVFTPLHPIRIPARLRSRSKRIGFRHNANNNILTGQPWRIELLICIGLHLCPFICIVDVAFSNILRMHC